MRWICLIVLLTSGCAVSRHERTNIELQVEVIPDYVPKAYLSGRATHEAIR